MGKDEMFDGAGFSQEELDSLLGGFDSGSSQASDDMLEQIMQEYHTGASDAKEYPDQGTFRSYDGSTEYHSFDEALPDASPEEFYQYSDADRELDEEDEYDDEYYDDDYDDDEDDRPRRRKKKRSVLSVIGNFLLAVITIVSVLYLFCIYSSWKPIKQLRTTYILTAMSTINHKWLATALIPPEIIDDVMREQYSTAAAAVGIESGWGTVDIDPLPTLSQALTEEDLLAQQAAKNEDKEAQQEDPVVEPEADRVLSADQSYFFDLFWELDQDSVFEYMDEHPDVVENGWYWIDVNRSAVGDTGTSMKTIYGDQVLAVNAIDGVILIRVYLSGNNSRGVLAICKDTSRVSLCPASTLGQVGQTAGVICEDNDGILAMTGSAFLDDGFGNGGQISGLAVCSGRTYGDRLGGTSKRLELRDDNMMYILDSTSAVGSGTRDACEFHPALIIDGTVLAEDPDWDGINPRAALGQSSRLETMMIVIEGRYADSLGCSTKYVADKLKQYGCVQALNLDGGTSAMLYYKGYYVNRCSNPELPGGRTLPTAWVYKPFYTR